MRDWPLPARQPRIWPGPIAGSERGTRLQIRRSSRGEFPMLSSIGYSTGWRMPGLSSVTFVIVILSSDPPVPIWANNVVFWARDRSLFPSRRLFPWQMSMLEHRVWMCSTLKSVLLHLHDLLMLPGMAIDSLRHLPSTSTAAICVPLQMLIIPGTFCLTLLIALFSAVMVQWRRRSKFQS